MRAEGLPLLTLWEHVVTMLHGSKSEKKGAAHPCASPNGPPTVTAAGGVASDYSVNLQSKDHKELWSAAVTASSETIWEHGCTHDDVFTGMDVPVKDPFKQLLIYASRRPKMRKVRLIIMEDNEAVIKILLKGRSNALRHLHRTHRVNTDWLFEIIKMENILIKYVNTKFQLADICTKAFSKADDWNRLMALCQLLPQKALPATPNIKPKLRLRGSRGSGSKVARMIVPVIPLVTSSYTSSQLPDVLGPLNVNVWTNFSCSNLNITQGTNFSSQINMKVGKFIPIQDDLADVKVGKFIPIQDDLANHFELKALGFPLTTTKVKFHSKELAPNTFKSGGCTKSGWYQQKDGWYQQKGEWYQQKGEWCHQKEENGYNKYNPLSNQVLRDSKGGPQGVHISWPKSRETQEDLRESLYRFINQSQPQLFGLSGGCLARAYRICCILRYTSTVSSSITMVFTMASGRSNSVQGNEQQSKSTKRSWKSKRGNAAAHNGNPELQTVNGTEERAAEIRANNMRTVQVTKDEGGTSIMSSAQCAEASRHDLQRCQPYGQNREDVARKQRQIECEEMVQQIKDNTARDADEKPPPPPPLPPTTTPEETLPQSVNGTGAESSTFTPPPPERWVPLPKPKVVLLPRVKDYDADGNIVTLVGTKQEHTLIEPIVRSELPFAKGRATNAEGYCTGEPYQWFQLRPLHFDSRRLKGRMILVSGQRSHYLSSKCGICRDSVQQALCQLTVMHDPGCVNVEVLAGPTWMLPESNVGGHESHGNLCHTSPRILFLLRVKLDVLLPLLCGWSVWADECGQVYPDTSSFVPLSMTMASHTGSQAIRHLQGQR